ncbi:MAG: SDR family oxidoreductase [Pseudomonadota bacterium]|nr:SDR family oxidoreductase [Pseudomonadota bacterium]
MNRLQDKRALITGAAGGIGAATARRFVEEGARVFLVDRDPAVAAVAEALGAGYAVADVSGEAATRAFIDAAVTTLGGLDIYVANAGTEGHVHPLVEVEQADFDRVIAVNVRSTWLGIKHAMPHLVATRGNFVATSSVAGLVGSAGLGPYVASKHAVLGLVKAAAVENGPAGVRVNAVCPGPIENRMMRSIEEQAAPGAAAAVHDGFTHMVPLGRYGTNEEIAAAITFLASPEASYCTGTALVADGGFVVG